MKRLLLVVITLLVALALFLWPRNPSCYELLDADVPPRWARELGVRYDSLTVACASPFPDLQGASYLREFPDGTLRGKIWIDPFGTDSAEQILAHELFHMRFPAMAEEQVEIESRAWVRSKKTST